MSAKPEEISKVPCYAFNNFKRGCHFSPCKFTHVLVKDSGRDWICHYFLRGETCPLRDVCQFYHERPLPQKNTACIAYRQGVKCRDKECRFTHGDPAPVPALPAPIAAPTIVAVASPNAAASPNAVASPNAAEVVKESTQQQRTVMDMLIEIRNIQEHQEAARELSVLPSQLCGEDLAPVLTLVKTICNTRAVDWNHLVITEIVILDHLVQCAKNKLNLMHEAARTSDSTILAKAQIKFQ